MRKLPETNKYTPFFAVGLWNIPGYTISAMEESEENYRENAKSYLDSVSLYNSVYMTSGKTALDHDRVEIVGSIPFYESLKAYGKSIENVDRKSLISDYAKRQYLKENVDDAKFVAMLDSVIQKVMDKGRATDYIWAPIDEIVNGGAGSGWCWHPEVGEKIKQRIKRQSKKTLVYTDLMGNGKANSYLFEKQYLKTHKAMPATPPFEALGDSAKIMPDRPMLGFSRTFDGRPLYVNGTASYVDYDLETLKTLYFECIKICAKDYKGCGDVFGINAFIDFNTHPVLAGISVDAIKAGAGKDVPVWLFFDGNGYARMGMSVHYFAQLLKCQMYTSIIHGATGILFWNDRSKSPDVFNALEPIVAELTDNIKIFNAKTLKSESSDNLHYMIKQSGKNKYIIASNTSKTETLALNIPNFETKRLAPLEVLISIY